MSKNCSCRQVIIEDILCRLRNVSSDIELAEGYSHSHYSELVDAVIDDIERKYGIEAGEKEAVGTVSW